MTAAVLERTDTAPAARWLAIPFAVGGLLIAAGSNLHPRADQATVRDTLAEMLDSPTWNVSHLLILAGLTICVGGFVVARRLHVFGPPVDRWLAVAAVSWGLASVELVPHLLAVRDLHALHHHQHTPILDTHLTLAVVATPLLGLSSAALAIAIARTARTTPAWILADVATVGGVAYAAAGPLIRFVGNPKLSILFAGQELLAVAIIGTAGRLAFRPDWRPVELADTAVAA